MATLSTLPAPCSCSSSTSISPTSRRNSFQGRHSTPRSHSSSQIVSNGHTFSTFHRCGVSLGRQLWGFEISVLGGSVTSGGGGGAIVGRNWRLFALTGAVDTETVELPAKLQEIVRLFQLVTDPKAKYAQLLHYAKQLKPLGKEYCVKENKVEGCVSQVWVLPSFNPDDCTVSFEADSDSLLTKGLAALLVEGLSGATVQEVLKVTPDFVHMLGLKQSLTPSRSNGFLNMLKLMQKKTLQMYMEAESAKSSGAGNHAGGIASQVGASVVQASEMTTQADNGPVSNENGSNQRSMKSSIEKKLQEALSPTVLVVDDVSHQHAGHAGVHKGAKETHFNVKVVSDKFTGNSLIKRHRLIYDLLDEELKNGVHALSLVTKSPSEPV